MAALQNDTLADAQGHYHLLAPSWVVIVSALQLRGYRAAAASRHRLSLQLLLTRVLVQDGGLQLHVLVQAASHHPLLLLMGAAAACIAAAAAATAGTISGARL